MDKQVRHDRAPTAARWTLNNALAWVATRDLDAVAKTDGEIAIDIWIAENPSAYPLRSAWDAWRDLSAAMADGLEGLGNSVRLRWDGGVVAHVVGVRFPPVDQPGAALGYFIFEDSPSILRPSGAAWAVSWVEIHDITFRSTDVIARFPPIHTPEASAERTSAPLLMLAHLSGPHELSPLSQSIRPPSMADARAAFERIVAEWQGANGLMRRPTRTEVSKRIVQELPGMTENRVRELWRKMAPHEWRGKGPRPQKVDSATE